MTRILAPFALLIAVLALLVGYYWVHKPFTPSLALSLAGLLVDFLTVAAVVALTSGLGGYVLRLLRLETDSVYERLALSSGLGLGFYALVVLVLGLIGFYIVPVLWGLLLLIGGLTYRQIRAWVVDFALVLRRSLSPGTPWTRFLALFSWVILLTAGLFAFAPPVAWDSLAYHLVGPQRYLETGQIAAQPDNFYLGLSQNVEMIYGATMGLFGRDTAAAPLHLWYAILGLIALAGLTRRYADPAAGWMAVVLPLSALSIWVLLGYPYVDLAVMAYAALVLVAAVRWRETEQFNWLVLAGILTGLAMGVKYTSGVLVISLWLYIAFTARQDRAGMIRGAFAVGLFAGVMFLPWALKGLLLYENPVYPFAFDGLNWDGLRGDFFNPPNTGLIAQGAAWQIPIIPVAATVFGVEKGAGYSFSAGVWLLNAPILLGFAWAYLPARGRRLALDAAIILAPMLLFWMGMAAFYEISMQTRLMTMLLPPFIVLGALGFHALGNWPEKPIHISFVVRGVLIATLLLGLLDVVRLTRSAEVVRYHLTGDREAYLRDNGLVSGTYNAMQQLETMLINDEVEAGGRVRLLWEPKGYHCPLQLDCDADVLLDHWRYPYAQGFSPDEIMQSWRDAGDDLILVDEIGRQFFERELPEQAPGVEAFPTARDAWLEPIWTDGTRYTLYVWALPE